MGLRSNGISRTLYLLLRGDVSDPDMASAQWFRQHGYLMDGQYSSLEDFLRADWEGGFLGTWDANDMITLINTWQDGDVTLVGKSQFRAAHDDDGFVSVLKSIKAKGLIMPCKTDLYFPVCRPGGLTCSPVVVLTHWFT